MKKMSGSRNLICRKKRRLRYILTQADVSHMIYKGHKITFVDIPDDEMPEAIAETKAMIDKEETERNE